MKAAVSQIIEVSREQLKRLDAKLRARELRLRAAGKQPLKRLFDASRPGVKVLNLYKF